jgi:phage terminase large subunit
MSFIKTTATDKIFQLKKRVRCVGGGTGASKTISILLWIIQRALLPKYAGEVISCVSESFPHLKRGVIRDFQNIMEEHGYWQEENYNRTDCIYSFPTGTKVEFFSVDQPGKVRGPRRDILFINEANNITYEIFTQLEVRTKKIIWMDWNPVSEYWFYEQVKGKPDTDFITLTYKDNEALDKGIVQAIESRMHNKNWWKVYGLGELGDSEGKVYKDWQFIDEIPHEARLERRGLDFGYSNDPSALVDIYYYNGGYILEERLYQKGMSNKQIADFITNLDYPSVMVIADSAEPKSIDEIRGYGVNVMPVTKGKDSITQGIQFVQDQRISVTKRSTNLIKEYRNYLWETDRDGKITNEPSPIFNHSMDAIRYGFEALRRTDDSELDLPDDQAMFKGGFY